MASIQLLNVLFTIAPLTQPKLWIQLPDLLNESWVTGHLYSRWIIWPSVSKNTKSMKLC